MAQLEDTLLGGSLDFDEVSEVGQFVNLDPAVLVQPASAAFLKAEDGYEAQCDQQVGGTIKVADAQLRFSARLEFTRRTWAFMGDGREWLRPVASRFDSDPQSLVGTLNGLLRSVEKTIELFNYRAAPGTSAHQLRLQCRHIRQSHFGFNFDWHGAFTVEKRFNRGNRGA